MLRLLATLGVVVSALSVACGGNTAGGGTGDGDSESMLDGPSDTPGGNDDPNADTELGDCKLGVAAYGEGASACAWVADNRCYSTRAMACNCACPRDRDSQCLSGFESGPEGRVDVVCY